MESTTIRTNAVLVGAPDSGKASLFEIWRDGKAAPYSIHQVKHWNVWIDAQLPINEELRFGDFERLSSSRENAKRATFKWYTDKITDVPPSWRSWDSRSRQKQGHGEQPVYAPTSKAGGTTTQSTTKPKILKRLTTLPTLREMFSQKLAPPQTTRSVQLNFRKHNLRQSEFCEIHHDRLSVIGLCFCVTDLDALRRIPDQTYPEIKFYASRVPIVLIATAIDRRHETPRNLSHQMKAKDFITTEEGLLMASQIGAARYVECSAVRCWNVHEVFMVLAAVVEDVLGDRQRE